MKHFLPTTLLVLISSSFVASAADTTEQEQLFERSIRPVLVERCFECHSGKKQEGGLRLDSPEFLLKGSLSGAAVTPGKLHLSRLWDVIQYDEGDIQMPPKEKLSDTQIAAFRTWIEQGAFWPESYQPHLDKDNQPAWLTHWAYQPIQKPELPQVQNVDWVRTPIDRFVLAKLEQAGLEPSSSADRRTWLRRVTINLTGLSPTFEEYAAFEADQSADAEQKVVDRLLESPRYGERWARHWLDVARYADTKGYVFQEDRNYPDSWTYRDWVIRAFNEDMPFDRFVKFQLAADKLTTAENASEQCAMGFLTLGRRFLNNRHDIIDDRIDVTTRGLMGLTVSCARCHDHKYDPIPAADYYSLYGVFNSSDEPKSEPSTLRLTDKEKPQEPYVFLRGQPHNHGPRVPRQFLKVIEGDDRKPFENGSGRLEMAEAIVNPDNPLTARVFVNRVWGKHFGSYLVDTPSDFGVRADTPTHPLLLDWLAQEFIDSGWSVKHLQRLITLSATYRQASSHREHAAAVDPENRLLWRMNRQRLDFESHRDNLLAAAGTLDLTMGGKSVEMTTKPFTTRRTIYGFIDRSNLPGLFRTFDFASPDIHAPRRYVTTVPQQALFHMNSPFLLQQTAELAERTAAPDGSEVTTEERIHSLYRIVFGREPSDEEVSLGREFLKGTDEQPESVVQHTWQYGYGHFDENSGRVVEWTKLPYFTGSTWQGGPQLPDPKLGWVSLSQTGGHPGDSPNFMAIRRWTAPASGTVSISGTLNHAAKPDQGDGVRGRIVSNRTGQHGDWTAAHGSVPTSVQSIEVKAGDVIDFVVDRRASLSHDSFTWTVRINGVLDGNRRGFHSADDFQGAIPSPLSRWARYAQVLMLSNEFVFVD